MADFETIIVGAGTMGVAAADHLARRGQHVLALEQFSIVHEMGSHSGFTRIIRHAYHESPDYVPLVQRSDQLWQELERESGERLLIRTGALIMGLPGSRAVSGALAASREHSVEHDLLDASAIRKRWPQFQIPDDWQGCFDLAAGFLLVSPCIKLQANRAIAHGAQIAEQETVESIEQHGDVIRVITNRRNVSTGRLIVTAGAWTTKLLRDLALPIQIKRKTLFWLRVKNPDEYSIGHFPIFLAEVPSGALYGFPIHQGTALKIANHSSSGESIDPDHVNRGIEPSDSRDILDFVHQTLPGVTDEILDAKVCLYSLTPDEDFIIDFHPQNRNILIAAGFSGHGFKFAPVVGEILADLATNGKTRHQIDRFRLSRFRKV